MSKERGQTREGGRDKGEGGLEDGRGEEGFPRIKGWRGFTGGKAGRD